MVNKTAMEDCYILKDVMAKRAILVLAVRSI
jgi:hypothetical protein